MRCNICNFYMNIMYFITFEWVIVMLGFFILIYHKKSNKAIDQLIDIAKAISCAIVSFSIFLVAIFTVFFSNIGVQRNIYLNDFYINHMLPWIFFITFYDIVVFLLPNLIISIRQSFKTYFLRLNFQKKLYFVSQTNDHLVFSNPSVVLLQ